MRDEYYNGADYELGYEADFDVRQQEVDRLLTKIEALEAALAFYADPYNWEPVYDKQFGRFASAMDEGKRARAVLTKE